MDFTQDGRIKIEDKERGIPPTNERVVLGYAVALGKVDSIEDLRGEEVDTDPRELDYDDSVAAINGLYRASRLNEANLEIRDGVIRSAGHHMTGLAYCVTEATSYLRDIALQVPQAAAVSAPPQA